VPDDQAAQGGRGDQVDFSGRQRAEFLGQPPAESLRGGRVLQHQRALQVLGAVQAAGQAEVAFEVCAGGPEQLQDGLGYNCEPVNPNATPEARALLKTCARSRARASCPASTTSQSPLLDTDRVFAATGKYPAIWGSDFGFLDGEDKDSIVHRDLMIEEAKKQAAAGSIIYLCWHMLRPTEDEPGKAGENGRREAGAAACRPGSPTSSGRS
jgi:hypothetical protein